MTDNNGDNFIEAHNGQHEALDNTFYLSLNQLNDVNNPLYLNRQQNPNNRINRLGNLYAAGNQIREMDKDNRLDDARSKRQLAEEFIGVFHDICEERDILELFEQTSSDTYGFQWKLQHEANADEDKPYLFISWIKAKPDSIVVKMLYKVDRYTRRVNLSKPDKFKAVIEESIAKLVTQNEQYNTIKQMIQTELDKIQDIEINRIRRHSTTWQIDISYEDKERGIIIQYDEKTKEFLFQIRHADKDLAFDLLREASKGWFD